MNIGSHGAFKLPDLLIYVSVGKKNVTGRGV